MKNSVLGTLDTTQVIQFQVIQPALKALSQYFSTFCFFCNFESCERYFARQWDTAQKTHTKK